MFLQIVPGGNGEERQNKQGSKTKKYKGGRPGIFQRITEIGVEDEAGMKQSEKECGDAEVTPVFIEALNNFGESRTGTNEHGNVQKHKRGYGRGTKNKYIISDLVEFETNKTETNSQYEGNEQINFRLIKSSNGSDNDEKCQRTPES